MMGVERRRTGDFSPPRSDFDMTLFIISIPLMFVAAAITVVPLVAMSRIHHGRGVEAPMGIPAKTAGMTEPQDGEEPLRCMTLRKDSRKWVA
jgi:hypothetical protein